MRRKKFLVFLPPIKFNNTLNRNIQCCEERLEAKGYKPLEHARAKRRNRILVVMVIACRGE